jgi:O-succinylbenzoate synthase
MASPWPPALSCGIEARGPVEACAPGRGAVKIDRVEVREVALPLRTPFETSVGRMTTKRFLLVAVSADGTTGYAECVADVDPFYLPETNATALHVLKDFIVPLVFTLEVAHPGEVGPALAAIRGHEMAKAAFEMAVWDLVARRQGVPLYRLLDGRGGTVEAGVSVGLRRDDADLLDQVAAEVEAGYRRVKLKIRPGRDLQPVSLIRQRFPDLPLMVDANGAYTLHDAEHLGAFDSLDLMMIEQPLDWDDLVDHAALQKLLQTPLCLDESIRSPDHARKALALGACRVVNVKAGRVGGFAAALGVHDACLAAEVPVWCGGMVESGVGRLANVHLQTLPGFTLPGDTSASARYYDEDLVDPPIVVSREGTIAVPEGPGLGHEIVWPRVERATVHREAWTRP